MGVITRSSEYLVAQGDQIYKCPTIRRRVEADAYTDRCLRDVKVDVYEYISRGAVTSKAEVIRGEGRERSDLPKTFEKAILTRSVRIRDEDPDTFGFTAGCPGCSWHTEKIGPHRGHNMTYRTRIEGGDAEHGGRNI